MSEAETWSVKALYSPDALTLGRKRYMRTEHVVFVRMGVPSS